MTNTRGYLGANAIQPRLGGTTIPANGGRHGRNLWANRDWSESTRAGPAIGVGTICGSSWTGSWMVHRQPEPAVR
jgi:hypothetical protein